MQSHDSPYSTLYIIIIHTCTIPPHIFLTSNLACDSLWSVIRNMWTAELTFDSLNMNTRKSDSPKHMKYKYSIMDLRVS